MSYEDLIAKGLIRRERIKPEQIAKFIHKAEKSIKSSEILLPSDEEAAFGLAYESMLLVGRALVFSYGFRPRAVNSHKTVVDFATRVLGEDYQVLTKKFDKMRKKRHDLIYEAKPISKTETKNAIKTAGNLLEQIKRHIKKNNPQKELF